MRRYIALCLTLCLYLVLHEGHLALKDGNEIKHIFPYPSEIYTETDNVILKQGLPLPNKESIASALEDYFS